MAGDQQPGIGPQNFASLGAGVSDIFQGFADETKAQGDLLEAQNYDQAAQLAFQNEQYTKMSTAIQEAQSNRELLLAQGRTTSEVAGAGFCRSKIVAFDMRQLRSRSGVQVEFRQYRTLGAGLRGTVEIPCAGGTLFGLR